MPTPKRCELWTDYPYRGGTVKARVPLDHVEGFRHTDRTTRDDEGELTLSKDTPAYAEAVVGRVWRLVMSDGSVREWRLWRARTSTRNARLTRFQLRSPLLELQDGAGVLSETVSGVVKVDLEWKALAPATAAALIIPFCPAGWALGTVDPTIPVNLMPSGWMPLRAFRELVAAITAQGVSAELNYRINGTSGYFVDIVSAIGAAAPTLDVRTGKNLLDSEHSLDRERYALEIVPIGVATNGQSATMGRCWIEVTAKVGTTLTVQQPEVGGPVLAFDDQWNGLYLIDDAGARQQITDCTAGGTQQLVVASATNVTAGRWYRLALNSAGDELTRIRKSEATAGPIRVERSAVLDATTNLCSNPAQRRWTGLASDPPDGWTKGGSGTLARTTTSGLWVYGGQSCKLTNNSGLSLTTPLTTVYVPTWATQVTFSLWVRIALLSGTPQIDFKRQGIVLTTIDLGTDYPATNTWHRVDYTASMAGHTGAVRTFQALLAYRSAGAGEVYVDSVQVAFAGSALPFTEGSNPTRLLTMANQYLLRYASGSAASFQATFADLERWDPERFQFDAVQLGQPVRVRDTELNYVGTERLHEITYDWKAPLAGGLTVASRLDDLVTRLSGITG